MITDRAVPNIFIPRNNWEVVSMRCKQAKHTTFSNKVAQIIAHELRVDPLANNKYRGQRTTQSRQLFIVMMRKYSNMTIDEITKIVRKDHSTYYNSKEAIDNYYNTDKEFREKYDIIDNKINQIDNK